MVYKWYILPIGGLYGTYHLLREPGNSIDPINFVQLLDIKQRRDLSPRSLLLRVIPDNVCLSLLKKHWVISGNYILIIIIFRKCIEHILPPTKKKHVHGIMGIQGYPPNATNPRNQELITGLLTTNDPLKTH